MGSLPDQKLFPPSALTSPPTYTGKLTAADVRTKMTKLIKDDSYKNVALAMQAAAIRQGGSPSAAQTVEQLYEMSRKGELPKGPRKRTKTFLRKSHVTLLAVACAFSLGWRVNYASRAERFL